MCVVWLRKAVPLSHHKTTLALACIYPWSELNWNSWSSKTLLALWSRSGRIPTQGLVQVWRVLCLESELQVANLALAHCSWFQEYAWNIETWICWIPQGKWTTRKSIQQSYRVIITLLWRRMGSKMPLELQLLSISFLVKLEVIRLQQNFG